MRPRPARERVLPWMLLALGLATVGLVASVWRPYAPAVGEVATDLDGFAPALLDLIAEFRTPRRFGVLAATAIGILVPLAAVLTRTGRRAVRRLAGDRTHAPLRGGLVAAAIVIATDLTTLPLSFAFGYVQDGAYGFRTSSLAGWARDWVVGHAFGWGVALAGGAALAWALRRWPRSWHWRGVTLGTLATLVVVLLSPLVLEPLWLRTSPLEPGPVRAEVEDVLERAGIEDTPVLVGDASRRTTRVNAYISGFGPSRRVVLWDTLLELPPDRVASVVAHELAHRRHHDVLRASLLTAAGLVPMLLAVRVALGSRVVRDRLGPRGASDPRLVAAGAAVALVAITAGLPIANWQSRRVEAAADHGALELTRDPGTLIRVQRIFVVRDLADPSPPAWIHLPFGTHPAPGQRIRAAVAFAREHDLELPDRAEVGVAEAAQLHPRLDDPGD